MGGTLIARKLREMNVPALRGGTWNGDRVTAVIKNEKYAGNVLLQKKYVKDYLTKYLVLNHGELPQYYAENTHPAIIDNETFDKAQVVMEARKRFYKSKDTSKNQYPFSGIIWCGNCGRNYTRKVNSGKALWQCSTYLKKGKRACYAKQIPEEVLYSVSEEVLGLDVFDEETFGRRIKKISVPQFNHLMFIFQDGHMAERIWEDRSRAESWTAEKREEARKRSLERRKGK